MSNYVLVHGAWYGGWCWDRVVPLLEENGHRVETPDLPAQGEDRTPAQEVTLETCAERVCEVLDAQSEPVILVGHSMAGVIVSRAAELRPESVSTLVYLAAFLLRPGETLLERASTDTESLILANMEVDEERSYAILGEEALREIYYHDCSEEDAARGFSRARPCPTAPFGESLRITEQRFGSTPRVYIECTHDRSLGPPLQREMYQSTPCERVLSTETGHSAFLAAPEELAAHLDSIG